MRKNHHRSAIRLVETPLEKEPRPRSKFAGTHGGRSVCDILILQAWARPCWLLIARSSCVLEPVSAQRPRFHDSRAGQLTRRSVTKALGISSGAQRHRPCRRPEEYALLPGDAIIAAGMVTYSGPFTGEQRQRFEETWRQKSVRRERAHALFGSLQV